jgi:hypothetical protein
MRKVRGVQLAVFVTLAGAVAAQDAGTPMAQPPAQPATAEENWIVKRFLQKQTVHVWYPPNRDCGASNVARVYRHFESILDQRGAFFAD